MRSSRPGIEIHGLPEDSDVVRISVRIEGYIRAPVDVPGAQLHRPARHCRQQPALFQRFVAEKALASRLRTTFTAGLATFGVQTP